MDKKHNVNKDMKKKNKSVFQLKITLDDSAPRVWRRILISKDASFFELHVAIQDAMGWGDGHLHSFSLAQKETAVPICIEFPDPERDELYGSDDKRDERVEKIADYFGVSIKQCQYTYDFGDNWTHEVLLEKEVPAIAGTRYPQCTTGKNACPSEDCGGVWGYQDMLKIIQDKKHSEHKDIMDWLGIDDVSEYDPTAFVVGDVEFRDAKKELRVYEKGFGDDTNDSAEIAEMVAFLKQSRLPQVGTWEVAQRVDPVMAKTTGKKNEFLVTVVVD
ncbi:MAG: plasmid pRiA4b ORF-3 family protein [Candidatus Moranbacteria bacterium]|nr:plasmid pRiA4b ORF-3 family protein [Candidatus Moranbacteria bacterium]